jgi:ankyrin repeat protein
MNLELKLRFAIASNDVSKASSLISNGCLNGSRSPLPLIHAAALGRLEIMTLLIDAGADMDAISNTMYQKTACDAAVRNNQFDALKLLVDRGANVRAVKSADHSLLKAAAQYGDDRMTLLLLDAGAPLNSLTHHDLMNLVASPKSIDVLERLLRRGVDVSALRDIDSNSLCHRVVWNAKCDDDLEVLVRAVVVDANVDINAADARGETAFHYAATKRNIPALRLLVELGADIDRQSTDFGTALRNACKGRGDSGPTVDFLIAIGANVGLALAALDEQGQPAHRRGAVLSAFLAADIDDDAQRKIALRSDLHLASAADVEAARRRISKARLDLVRARAADVCIGLQSLRLNALQLCEILMRSCGVFGSLIEFHEWWAIATKVKHFAEEEDAEEMQL